jgi:hypothetical protein
MRCKFLAISLLICFLHFPGRSSAQRAWAAFFPNNWGMGGPLTWKWNAAPAYEILPALYVAGNEGGPAFFLGTDSKGSYLSVRGKILYWDGEHLRPVPKLPDHMVARNGLDLVIDNPFDANASKYTMAVRGDYRYRGRGGDPFLPFPCGRVANISWAYNPGGTSNMLNFPVVWIEGNPRRAAYHGYNYQGSYLTDMQSGKLLKWDGKNLTEISALPDFMIASRDYYLYTFNPTPLLAKSFGPPNQVNKPGSPNGDPYLLMRGNQEVGGRWGISRGISWYYPREGATSIPMVTLHEKSRDVPALYQGYDGLGAYLVVNDKPMVWDGDDIYTVAQIPPPTSLLNVPPPASPTPAAEVSATPAASVGEDPFFAKGGNGIGVLSWEYEGNNSYPTIYMGLRGKALQKKADYHGYDAHGAYFTYNDGLIGNCLLMWDGKGNIIPVGRIPDNLKNAH